jgi:polar amino acid transport system substrate-binding protein
MSRPYLSLLLATALLSPLATMAKAQEQAGTNAPQGSSILPSTQVATGSLIDTNRVLKVGITERIPYSTKNELGEWHGIGPDLWEEVSKKLGIKYQYEECLMSEMHDKLKNHEIDMILVTGQSADFLKTEVFTQPYVYSHGSAVIGHLSVLSSIENIINHLIQSGMFLIVMCMFLTMFVISLILVYFEGRHGQGHFEGSWLKRFASALWFTAVTMTSVGYGDSAKLSFVGRTITFLWMMMGILFIALFTGSVVSSLTTAELNSSLVRLEDLSHYRCGVFAGSKMDKVVAAKGIPARKYPTLMEGFGALQRGQISAFAVDAISANTIVNQEYPGQFKICIMPTIQLLYSFAFRKDDPFFDPVNDEVIRSTLHPDWRGRMEHWSGPIPF